MVKKLTGHPSAQCKVVTNEMGIILVSYTTEVIRVKRGNGGYIVSCTGLYSRTTIKHIGWFLKEYLPSVTYQDIKGIAGTCERILLDTNMIKYDGVLFNECTNELIFDEQ